MDLFPYEPRKNQIAIIETIKKTLLSKENIVFESGTGSGKTIFLLEFLWSGLAYKENGLYLSFESDLTDIFNDANLFGWNFELYRIDRPEFSLKSIRRANIRYCGGRIRSGMKCPIWFYWT